MAYLLVNKETNIVDEAVAWDGDTNKWNPPPTHIALPLATTRATDWSWNKDLNDWEEVENIGNGSIGDTWNGSVLKAPHPSTIVTPALPSQPNSSGTQDL